MTESEARNILAVPLKFGDEAQLAALQFLRDCADCRLRVMHCRRCDGDGVNRRGYACPWCAADYDADVLRACGIDAKAEGPVLVERKSDERRSHRRLVEPLH